MRASASERRQLLLILLIMFVVSMSYTIPYPILPPLFLSPENYGFFGFELTSAQRNLLLGLVLTAYPLAQFIGCPIFGSYSDQYGRKATLMWSLAGSAGGYALSTYALWSHSLFLFLLSRLIVGFMESNTAIMMAMVADLKSICKYKSVGRLNGCLAFGYIVGPIVSSIFSNNHLLPWFSYATSCAFAGLSTFSVLLLSLYFLKESKPKAVFEELPLMKQFNLIHRLQKIGSNPFLKELLIVCTLFTLAVDLLNEFGPVYLTGYWGLSSRGIAFYNAFYCAAMAVGGSWLSHHTSRYFSLRHNIFGAMIVSSLMFFLIACGISKGANLIFFIVCGLSIGLAITQLTVQITHQANVQIQGEALGIQQGLRMFCDASICFMGGFAILSSYAAPLFIASVVVLIALRVNVAQYRARAARIANAHG